MGNVWQGIKDAMKAWQEGHGGKIMLLLERLKQGLRESPQVRAVTAVVAAVCGVGGLFMFQGDGAQMTSGSSSMEPVTLAKMSMKQNDRLEVAGSDVAVNKESLHNPFLPNHPTREESLQDKAKPANSTVPRAAYKETYDSAASGTSAGQPSGMPISVPVKQTVEKEQKQIYLQGIIAAEDMPGALLTLDGQSRFLLAGENWQGYVLESVSGEEAVVNGYVIHIGDTVAM